MSAGYLAQQYPQIVSQQPVQAQPQVQKPIQGQPQPQQAQPQQAQAQLPQQAPAQGQQQLVKPQTPGAQATTAPVSPKTATTKLTVDPNMTASRIAAVVPGAIPVTTVSGGLPVAVQGVSAAMVQQVKGLEQRVRELEQIVEEKDQHIAELQATLVKGGMKPDRKSKTGPNKGLPGGGFQKVAGSKPQVRYTLVDQNDPIDVRLEEFYNSTGSAVQFRRINHGFYRFGETIVELDIINHKLMARTEDGWNRGKSGAIEKFLMYYENIEREKAGIIPEA